MRETIRQSPVQTLSQSNRHEGDQAAKEKPNEIFLPFCFRQRREMDLDSHFRKTIQDPKAIANHSKLENVVTAKLCHLKRMINQLTSWQYNPSAIAPATIDLASVAA